VNATDLTPGHVGQRVHVDRGPYSLGEGVLVGLEFTGSDVALTLASGRYVRTLTTPAAETTVTFTHPTTPTEPKPEYVNGWPVREIGSRFD
jgi:hypothetical protein